MKGTIIKIEESKTTGKLYGFIKGENDLTYYFNEKNLSDKYTLSTT